MQVRLFASLAVVLLLLMAGTMAVWAAGQSAGLPGGAPREQPWPPFGPGAAWRMFAPGHEKLDPQATGFSVSPGSTSGLLPSPAPIEAGLLTRQSGDDPGRV